MRSSDISVVIPLYNKERTIGAALGSVLAQSLKPLEIVVVDDGSTDGSARIVEQMAERNPEAGIKLIRQPNGGVSAARNRAIAEARGEYVALLDGDDLWRSEHLAEIWRLVEEYPDCGIYATAFEVDDGRQLTAGDTPECEGVVDFFVESLIHYVVIPSAAVLRRSAVLEAGGFPEGMRIGEDQYLWIKMARLQPVCFSPARTIIYSKAADNRSAAIYRPEKCDVSFADLLEEASGNAEREYIARVALGKALVHSAKGGTQEAAAAIRTFGYTQLNGRALRKLKFVNALPVKVRQPFLNLYNRLAWAIARKGL